MLGRLGTPVREGVLRGWAASRRFVRWPPLSEDGRVEVRMSPSVFAMENNTFLNKKIKYNKIGIFLGIYLKWSLLMNFLEQTGQAKFFSPVWVRVWRASSSDLANLLPQPPHPHGNGRSPVWQKEIMLILCLRLILEVLVFKYKYEKGRSRSWWAARLLLYPWHGLNTVKLFKVIMQ